VSFLHFKSLRSQDAVVHYDDENDPR
jgi:hypothetical protein